MQRIADLISRDALRVGVYMIHGMVDLLYAVLSEHRKLLCDIRIGKRNKCHAPANQIFIEPGDTFVDRPVNAAP